MVSSLPKKPKKKFPTRDALEFVASLNKGSSSSRNEIRTKRNTGDISEKKVRGLKPLTWETTTEEGRFVGSGDATKRLGIDGVKAMLKSLPLSTASAGKFKPESSSQVGAEKVVKQVKKKRKKGPRSTKIPKPLITDRSSKRGPKKH